MTLCALALTLGAAAWGGLELRKANEAKSALVAADLQQQTITARIVALEEQVRAETKRAREVEKDNALLQAALKDAQTAEADAAAPITREVVEARYRRGKELAQSGDTESALKELLWCFDIGMRRVSSFSGVRASFLLKEIQKLGPPGIAALHERRNKARQILLTGTDDSGAASDFSSISRTLDENHAVLNLYDQMPAGPSRRTLANYAFSQLVEARRYSDAISARTFVTMTSSLEMMIQESTGPRRDHAIRTAATNVEVLAGAGELAHAQSLIARLLGHDSSESTRAILQRHLERAGHAGLLESNINK